MSFLLAMFFGGAAAACTIAVWRWIGFKAVDAKEGYDVVVLRKPPRSGTVGEVVRRLESLRGYELVRLASLGCAVANVLGVLAATAWQCDSGPFELRI